MCCLGPHPALWPTKHRLLLCWATDGTIGQLMLRSLLQDLSYLLCFPCHDMLLSGTQYFQSKLSSTILPSQKQLLLILLTLPEDSWPLWEASPAAVSLSYPLVSSWSPSALDDSRKHFACDAGKIQTDLVYYAWWGWCFLALREGGDWCGCSRSLAPLQRLLFWVEVDFQIICK